MSQGDTYDQYDQALAREAAAVALARQETALAAGPGQQMNPDHDRAAAVAWRDASYQAGFLRSIEETHGGAFAGSGRDTNKALLALEGIADAPASLRMWSEDKFSGAAFDRAKYKAKLGGIDLADPRRDPQGGGLHAIPGLTDAPGGSSSSSEPSLLGLGAIAGVVAWLIWRFVR